MYESFFGLRERPFELTPNPRFLLLTPGHREALSNLRYGISARKALTVLTGEAGTGKSTIIRTVLGQITRGGDGLPPGRAAYINNPTLSRQEFFELVAREFRLPSACAESKAKLLLELDRMLRELHATGGSAALVIDEAQSLSLELLEEIRLLANIETDTVKLLPLVMAGQPELAEWLNQPELRQLKQRIALRCRLEPLTVNETAAYVAARLRHAGADPAAVFTREAIRTIFERSKGLPRTINVICDNALVTAFALSRIPVGVDIVNDVCRDFELPGGHRIEPPPQPVALEIESDESAAAARETQSAGRLSLLRGWRPRRHAS